MMTMSMMIGGRGVMSGHRQMTDGWLIDDDAVVVVERPHGVHRCAIAAGDAHRRQEAWWWWRVVGRELLVRLVMVMVVCRCCRHWCHVVIVVMVVVVHSLDVLVV